MEHQKDLCFTNSDGLGLAIYKLDQKVFQFSGDLMEEAIISIDSILICGRSIPFDKPRNFRAEYAVIRSHEDESKLRLPAESTAAARSNSPGNRTSKATLATTGICRYGSNSPRKYRAVIGVAKFRSKMEMKYIKRRQSLQAPAPLVPAAFNGGEAILAVTTGRGRGHWGCLLRPLRCTSQLVNVLSRASLGCIARI